MTVTPTRIVVLGVGAAVGLLILALKAFGVEGEPTRDAVTEAEVHAWTGGISTAGLLVWGATAGAAAMASLALWRFDRTEPAQFLLLLAAGIGYLGVDDALLIHEDVLPNQVGVQEQTIYLLLALAGLAWAVRFRSFIRASDVALLYLAVSMFALGVAVDLFDVWSVAGEDWLKYVGLVALAGWVVDVCLRQLSALRPTRGPAGGTPPPVR